MGKGIALDTGAPTTFRVPLYPIFLAGLTLGHRWFWPIVVAEAVVGAATVWCAAWLARDMFGPRAAALAAAITAIYPYYVVHDTALQETGFFTLITLASVIALRRSVFSRNAVTAAGSGLLLGLDVLTRATIVPFAAVAPVWLAWRTPGTDATRVSRGLACALVLAASLSPWLWRSYQLTGFPVLSTELGLELWNGNNAALFRHYPKESSDVSKSEAFDSLSAEDRRVLAQLGDNEALRGSWFLHRGQDYMLSNPCLSFTNGLSKIGAGFGILPSPRRSFWPNLIYAFTYSPIMFLGLWGMWWHRRQWRDDILIYSLFGMFALVSAVFFAHTSHRAYLDVYWIVFAAGLVAERLVPAYPRSHTINDPQYSALR